MNLTLFAHELRSNAALFGIFFCVLTMYIGVVTGMFDPSLGDSLNALAASMPELFAAFGMGSQATTLADFMMNYLYGFLLTVIPFVLILMLVNRMVVQRIERGTMACLLATPVSRLRIAASMVGALVAMLLAMLALTAAAGLVFAELFFPGELDVARLMQAHAGLLGLWLFLAGICTLSACALPAGGPALWVGGGIGVGLFLLQMGGQIGGAPEILSDVNPLNLYDPFALASGETSAIAGAVALGVCGIVLLVAAIVTFTRRNLSV